MSQASRVGGPLTSGGPPYFSTRAPLSIYARLDTTWPLPSTSSGVPRSFGRSTGFIAELDAGRPVADRAGGRARHRQDAPARRARRPRRRARTSRPVGVRVGAGAGPAVLGLRRRARRVPPRAGAAAARRPRGRRAGRAGDGVPLALRRWPRDGRWRRSTSATAAIAPCARCWSCWRAAQPLVLMLDDLHWCDPASIELLGALLHRPPAAPVLLALAAAPAPDRRAPRGRARSRASRPRPSSASSWSPSRAARPTSCSATRSRATTRPSCTRRAAATRSTWSSSRARRKPEAACDARRARASPSAASRSRRPWSPRWPRSWRCSRRVLAACSRARPWPVIRSIPTWPARRPASAAAAAIDALDELLALDLIRATDVPRRFRFRHPLVRRAVYEAAPGGWRLGAHERTAAALAERGAPASARAHHVEIGGASRRRRRGRGAARGGRGRRAAGACERRALVRRRAAPAAADRARAGAGRAPARALGSARRHRAVLGQPRDAAREHAASCREDADALRVRLVVGVRRRRASPRPAQAGPCPSRERARRARRSPARRRQSRS